ncbi:Clp protease N-terminal domain-containing protein [Anaeromyxobacter diazotrophicus]|uniref:Clp R domain-containing protein n=1 Tax=Anaeromyxobacter diazotrophicus TaxID=2590199 RepID=A0A7I9VSH4_9BACT|nr:Clp protease N-terminal domain-containing protein [Anaeromyxobacter diazotrophicus]GEJ59251.1 hypothetical protein AMYX_39920 [Anaeromyxobacter diazotrophicus]
MAETARGDVEGLCDICHRRPAAVRVAVSQNGRRQTLKVCDDDYARLQAQARGSSPFESLFGGSLFGDDVFGDFFGGDGVEGGDEADVDRGRGRARTRPRGRAADREAVDLADYLSQQGEEILQQAARTAVDWGARDVDSEHLLHVLADNDVVQAVLARFKLSPQDLKRQVEELRPRRQGKAPEGREQVGVSPRVKAALEAAFRASRDLGHSYVAG